MQHVLVIDEMRTPLMPCTPGKARRLLDRGRAVVWRRYPFTIMLTDGVTGDVQHLRLKIDPGSRVTGLALVREDDGRVVWAAELTHRGQQIKARLTDRRVLRRGRRTRKTRYRPPRLSNRTRPQGWLAPSLRHRVLTTLTWVRRLRAAAPITAISVERVRFDTQLMENPNISGVEYQQGTLHGYEVREFLLEAFGCTCAYCGAKDTPLQIEHIIPRSRGGSDRVSNLTIACINCNQRKGNKTAAEFGHPEVQEQVKASLRDVAAVNSTRWAIWETLVATGLPVECGTGGRTKYNRTRLGLPKAHWIDAACVGQTGENVRVPRDLRPLLIRATGHGNHQICATDAHGFPKQHRSRAKRHHGVQTGDIVRANKPNKPPHLKDGGVHIGRVAAARASGSLDVRPDSGRPATLCVHAKYCTLIHRADGYEYVHRTPRNHSPEPGRSQACPVSSRLRAGRAALYDLIIRRCSVVSQPPVLNKRAWLMHPIAAPTVAGRGRRNHLLALPRLGPPAHWSRCLVEGIQGARVPLDGTEGLEHGRCTCCTSVPAAPRAPQLSRVIGLHPIDHKASNEYPIGEQSVCPAHARAAFGAILADFLLPMGPATIQ